MVVYDNVERIWFGTEQRMGWIETPQTGADVSSIGQSAQATLQNGGGNVRNSWDSHKVYQFSWGDSAPPSLVSLLQAYRNGSYGRGFLYFHDPMHYTTNLLPKRWADPSMAVNYEAEPLIPDANPTAVPVVSTANNYPVNAARYTLAASYSSQTNSTEHFIPIPDGMTLSLGAVYDGPGQLYVRTNAGITLLPGMSPTSTSVVNTVITGQPWARIGIRNVLASVSSITITAMSARLSSFVPDGGRQYTNLATNPSFESTVATVELRRNLLRDADLRVPGQWSTSMTGTAVSTTGSRFLLTGTAATTRLGVIQTLDTLKPAGAYSLSVNFEPLDASIAQVRIYLLDTSGSVIRATGLTSILPGNNRYDFTLDATGTFNRVYLEMVGASLPVNVSGYMGQPMLESGLPPGQFFSPTQGTGGNVDLTSTWVGAVNTTESILSGSRASGINTAVSGAFVYQSSEWYSTGSKSVKVDPFGTVTATYGSVILSGLPAGAECTVAAKVRLAAPQVGTLHPTWVRQLMAQATGMVPNNVLSNRVPNAAGEWDTRVTFTLPAGVTTATIFLMNGSLSTPVWFDDITVVVGDYNGPTFNGDSAGAVWNGTPNASTSTYAMPVDGEVGQGPWYSGEGHSGCRFVGNPTVINYTGVGEGQIGLSAIFQEVGAWE